MGETEPNDNDKRQRILKARTERLARPPEAAEPEEDRIEVVEFLLSGEHYAIESCYIDEVCPVKELTPLPCTPHFVLGIVSVRGKILSVIDLCAFFDLPRQGLSDLNKVIVLHNGAMEFGILADAILDVQQHTASDLNPSLPTLTGIRADFLKGVTAERLVVLDGEKLLADSRIVVHEEV